MTTPAKEIHPPAVVSIERAKHWIMIIASLVFIVLYAAALTGWLRPIADSSLVARLEPIIFVLIGYYFGQLPFTLERKTRKKEFERTMQKLDETQEAKQQIQRERDALTEKIGAAKIALDRVIAVSAKDVSPTVSHDSLSRNAKEIVVGHKTADRLAEIVRNILDS